MPVDSDSKIRDNEAIMYEELSLCFGVIIDVFTKRNFIDIVMKINGIDELMILKLIVRAKINPHSNSI